MLKKLNEYGDGLGFIALAIVRVVIAANATTVKSKDARTVKGFLYEKPA
jgi:hypothetical protein